MIKLLLYSLLEKCSNILALEIRGIFRGGQTGALLNSANIISLLHIAYNMHGTVNATILEPAAVHNGSDYLYSVAFLLR